VPRAAELIWVGAVLTGGSSRRMGRDKATLAIAGVAMADRVAGALRAAGAVDVVCVGHAVGTLGATVEDEPGSGPLGAVVAALRWAGDRNVLVAACDLVTPAPRAFAAVVAALVSAPGVDAAIPVIAERTQPLAAAYAPRALRPLVAAFERGERSITAALAALEVVRVEGLDARAFVDADEPGDLPRYPGHHGRP